MPIIWVPDGTLDVATAPSNLPQQVNGSVIESHDFARAKNLEIIKKGKTEQRKGSDRSSYSLAGKMLRIVDQEGDLYTFTDKAFYKDGTKLQDLSTGTWGAVAYNGFSETTRQIYALAGNANKRIQDTVVNKWGIAAPSNAPTLATGGGTGLTGTFNFKYTYVRQDAGVVVAESNPSPAAGAAITISNETVDVTWTASTDSQVTHVRIYRTTDGGGTYFFDQVIAIGTTTTESSRQDTSLGAQVEEDNNPPPSGTILGGPFYGGVLFIVQNNLLYFSKAKRPESWPSTNNIEVSTLQEPLTCLTTFSGQPYIFSRRNMWLVQGTGTNTFFPIPFAVMTGAQNPYGAIGVEGQGIFHIGADGVYLYSAGRDRKFSESRFDPLFKGKAANGMPAIQDIENAWIFKYRNKLFMHYDDGNVIVWNMDSTSSYYYKYDQRMYAPTEQLTGGAFLAGDESSFVRTLEANSNTDAGTAISWEAQSKDFTLQTRAHFPRWVKYDTEGTMTGTLILDDEVHQTHAISEDRNTRRRLVKTGNGKRCALRLNGSTPPTIYALEME